jgi:hypothetical protein
MSFEDIKRSISPEVLSNRTGRIKKILEEKGACCTGFADISSLVLPLAYRYPFGICFAICHDDEIVNQLPNDEQWIKMSSSLTEKTGSIYRVVQELIESWGYHCSRVPSTTRIDELPDPGEELP